MIEIVAYAIGVMYTPGPVNLLALNAGVNGQCRSSAGFCVGVGTAMLVLFLLFGWLGASLVSGKGLIAVSILGCGFILYLAMKILRATVDAEADTGGEGGPVLRFHQGLGMQLLNPKGIVATLPIATIQFPGAGIEGMNLVFWSIVLSILAIGAPGSYALAGALVGRQVRTPTFFRWFNRVMAGLLIYVALTIGYDYIVVPLLGG